MNGIIFNIQNYAVHDGPGIRTLVFLKGCPLRCQWCCNPESHLAQPQLRFIPFLCKNSHECIASCPTSSITYSDGAIHRNFDDCHTCQSKDCVEACNYDAISISGKEISCEELVGAIARDMDFYRNSGGGVTFSGGEPLMQPGFLKEALQQCKALGIHTAIETCGWADRKAFEAIFPFTDLFLYDLKIIDPESHLFYTGKPVGPILENLAYLSSRKARIIIRFPLVPGITDTTENLAGICEIMNKNGLDRIDIEPYHSLGKEKYAEHGMTYRLDHTGQCDPVKIAETREYFTGKGFFCEVM
jgi:pyruvate formate lyase activating enzyme